MKNITQTEIKGFHVVVPPLSEQAATVSRVRAFEQEIQWQHSSHSKLRKLKQGLMDDLLTGRVRVQVLQEASA